MTNKPYPVGEWADVADYGMPLEDFEAFIEDENGEVYIGRVSTFWWDVPRILTTICAEGSEWAFPQEPRENKPVARRLWRIVRPPCPTGGARPGDYVVRYNGHSYALWKRGDGAWLPSLDAAPDLRKSMPPTQSELDWDEIVPLAAWKARQSAFTDEDIAVVRAFLSIIEESGDVLRRLAQQT